MSKLKIMASQQVPSKRIYPFCVKQLDMYN